MEKFKIKASNTNKIEDHVIEVIPDVISSDIPYYTEIEVSNKSVIKLRNNYVSNKERKQSFSAGKLELEIGAISGKVYKISVNEVESEKQLKKIIKTFLKDRIADGFSKESRYYNNVKFSTDIFKDLSLEVKNRYSVSNEKT